MQKMSRLYIQRHAKLNFNPNPLAAVLVFMSMLLTAFIITKLSQWVYEGQAVR